MFVQSSGRARAALIAAAVASACGFSALTAAAPGVPFATADPTFDPVPTALLPAEPRAPTPVTLETDGPWSVEFQYASIGPSIDSLAADVPGPDPPTFTDIVAAPEPATLALLSMGIMSLLIRRKRS